MGFRVQGSGFRMLGGRSEDSFSASKIGGLGWAAGRMVCVKFGAWAGYIQRGFTVSIRSLDGGLGLWLVTSEGRMNN